MFIPVRVWSDSEVYEAPEEVAYKSDDYITVDSIDTLNKALSMFSPNQQLEVLGQILDIQGIDLDIDSSKGYVPVRQDIEIQEL